MNVTAKRPYPHLIKLHVSPVNKKRGFLRMGRLVIPCDIGRSGTTRFKREGDGATPFATMRILQGFYRADRLPRPKTRLKLQPIKPDMGWCDDPSHRLYNRQVRLPFMARHEKLWREDEVYDIVLDLSWNRGPIRRGKGSAIFLHIMRGDRGPTEGCIAVSRRGMGLMLERVGGVIGW